MLPRLDGYRGFGGHLTHEVAAAACPTPCPVVTVPFSECESQNNWLGKVGQDVTVTATVLGNIYRGKFGIEGVSRMPCALSCSLTAAG